MTTAHRSPTELLKALGGFLAAAGAAGAYFAGALAGLNRLLPEWLQLSDAAVKSSATAIAAAGAFLIWHALRTRSRLLHPEALLVSPNWPEHLAGRVDDIEELIRICSANPLVFLIGESGAGKSALLQAGLIPNLPSAFLPVYLQHWGEDWEKGPWQSLAVSLFEESPPELRQQPGGSGTGQLTDYARRLRSVTGKRLLLILDQFDDYVSAHHARFVCNRVWIDAETSSSRTHSGGLLPN